MATADERPRIRRDEVDDEKALPPLLADFRTALREEIEAARRAASSAAIELVSGRRIGERGGSIQYVFLVESPLNLPDDSPADLLVAGQRGPIEATIVAVEGLSVVVSVPLELGEFIGRARLQSDLTHLLRTLITRIEDLAETPNPAGDRLLGRAPPTGEPAPVESDWMNAEQRQAVASAIGRDLTFIWGPPGTGKTRTIGGLTTELHQRARSVLLVSHTNAAVDQALLRVVDEIEEEELEQGLVLRLGETKERMVAERPLLLAQTHVERRSAELITERDTLNEQQLESTRELASLDRLLAVAEWLTQAPAEINEWRGDVDALALLERGREESARRLCALEEELAPWLELEPDAKQAFADAQRVQELQETLPLLRQRASELSSTLADVRERRQAAESLAREAETYAPRVRAARERLTALRAELPQREPLLLATHQELAELATSLAAAQDLLVRAEQSNAVTRRLRGIPHPDEQRREIESLRARAERLEEARRRTAEALESLQQEFGEAQETIDRHGHLPDPGLQGQEARTLLAQEKLARSASSDASDEFAQAERELRELGKPLERFEATHSVTADVVVAQLARLVEWVEPVEREVSRLDSDISNLVERLRDRLDRRVRQLRMLALVEAIPKTFAEKLTQVEEALGRGRELLSGRDIVLMRGAREQVQRRLREIAARLGEIEEALQHIEELVIAEARVVATTLTRAYKRDSIQARKFDTVILDEASMAPIPALWVVAARAERNVVLVGDFQQLPPIHHSTHELAEEWLGRDIFDQAGVQDGFLRDTCPPHCVALKEQQRMHPAISAIANRFVYTGMLRDGPGVEDDSLLDGWYAGGDPFDAPVLLVDTSKLNAWVTSVNHGGRSSRLNFLSATVCADLAQSLLRPDREPFVQGERPRILLGAPYRPHAKLLSLLAKEQGLVGEVVAGTAHTFQGNEAPVVIFDLVNDEPHWRVGMFDSRRDASTQRLLNVALTRAQRRLIIVGDFVWIERQARRDGILRRLVGFLKETYTVIDAAEVVPAGLAARAAESQRATQAGREHVIDPQLVVAQDRFFDHLYDDLAAARERIVIYSPFATAERVGRLEVHLRAAVERGAEVWVVTKPLEERARDRQRYDELESGLRTWGVRIVHKRGMHEKLVLIDGHVLWQGSLNPLSFSATQEIMERRDNCEITSDYTRVLRLDELLSAYRAKETTCPYCGGEVVAAEGRDEPFYWRCIEDDCFSRSIGDPMPVDGRVVCHSCGGELEFRWPNETPFWRCTDNHRHRQPLARSHMRLPKMREIIPTADLRKLDRRFDDNASRKTRERQLRLA